MVTYDVVPEIESYLHTINKTLHSSLDEMEKSGEDYENAASGQAAAQKSSVEQLADDEAAAPQQDHGDLYDRIQNIFDGLEQSKKECEEALELKRKYKIGSHVYDGHI